MNAHRPAAQRGFTVVEFMVGLILSLLVALASVSLYVVVGQSYRTVDASQQLNDNARYAFEVIGQAIRSAGYREYMPPVPGMGLGPVANPILGYSNSKINTVTSVTDFGGNNRGGVNGSDSLALQFYGASKSSDSAKANDAVINCQGVSVGAPAALTDLGLSLFWIRNQADGEPALECLVNRNYWPTSGTTISERNSQPIVRGVEVFKVMYAVQSAGSTTMPGTWVEAPAVTNWKAVYAIRVGLVLRGPPGSAQAAAVAAGDNSFYPLGKAFTGTLTTNGLKFTPSYDGRLRRAYTTMFLVRNDPNLS